MSVSPDFVAHEAKIAVVRALTATVAPDNKRALFDALAAASIQHVVISFDGSEGSGQIEGTQVWVSDKATGALPDVEIPFAEVDWDGPVLTSQPRRVADVIETMAYAFLEETHDG